MENLELGWIFARIATLLELKGENIYKIRAYLRAAKTISSLSRNIRTIGEEQQISSLPGIGKALQEKIEEYLRTGKVSYLENLEAEIPWGVVQFLDIPGVGPKLARQFYKELGVQDIDELQQAAKTRKIRLLKGLGGKTELSVLAGIERLKQHGGRTSLGMAYNYGVEIKQILQGVAGVKQVEIAGSVRRFKETVKDLDFLVISEKPELVLRVFSEMPLVESVIAKGNTKASVTLKLGLNADLRVLNSSQFACGLHYFTGSKEHNIRMRQLAQSKGYQLSEYALLNLANDRVIATESETQLFEALGLCYIPPELREDQGEIEQASLGELPKLISEKDIRGDLHMHTTYSDGVNTIKEMALAAQELGREYIAICDHSRSLSVARGLSVEKLASQSDEIKKVSQEVDFPILRGVECDILADGSLDYPDSVLDGLDIVVASVHSGFTQAEDKMTERIIKAVKQPTVNILAHPTGRLIGQREPYALDMEAIIQAAYDYGTILEINASPNRLDLSDTYARMAKEKGVKIAINSDAHSIQQFDYFFFGVNYARRAWLTADDVVNTWRLPELMDCLASSS